MQKELETIVNVPSVYQFYQFCHLKSDSGQLVEGHFPFLAAQAGNFVIFRINVDAVRLGQLDVQNLPQIERQLLLQLQQAEN